MAHIEAERRWRSSEGEALQTHPAGRKQIAAETESWSRIAEAMARIIEATS